MTKKTRKNVGTENLEDIPVPKKCCHCNEQYCYNTHHRLFSLKRKVTKHNIDGFNRLMTKSHQRRKKMGDIWCDKCDLVYDARLKAEKRTQKKKLDLEIEKNENIDAEEPETEEGDFKEDGALTNTFLQAIVGNLLFQIQISKN
jgi:hypothetical protein